MDYRLEKDKVLLGLVGETVPFQLFTNIWGRISVMNWWFCLHNMRIWNVNFAAWVGPKEAAGTIAAAEMAVAVAERIRSKATEERDVAQQEARLAVDKMKVSRNRMRIIAVDGDAT